MRFNEISMFIGVTAAIVLCLIYASIVHDPMLLWGGLLFIAIWMLPLGFKDNNIPIEHVAVLKILGKRVHIIFREGRCWILPFLTSIEIVNCKLDVVDVPLIKIFTQNNVEIGVNTWVYLKVEDPFIYLNLQNPQEIIKTSAVSKTNEATSEFVSDKTDKECRNQESILQEKIKEKMAREEKKLGVGVSDIDIRPIEPTEQFKQIYAEDFKKDVDTKRHVKDAKRIAKATPGLTPTEVVNTTHTVEGKAKKEIKEDKKTIKLDVEPSILGLIAEFLPKKKEAKND